MGLGYSPSKFIAQQQLGRKQLVILIHLTRVRNSSRYTGKTIQYPYARNGVASQVHRTKDLHYSIIVVVSFYPNALHKGRKAMLFRTVMFVYTGCWLGRGGVPGVENDLEPIFLPQGR